MSLIFHHCNENEISEIVSLIRKNDYTDLKFTYSQRESMGFIYCKIKAMTLQFQEMFGRVTRFSLQVNDDSYEVFTPTGELLIELQKILTAAKDKVHHGLDLKEKIARELSK
jgi:hypothetical protein